jgi:capsid portal protein
MKNSKAKSKEWWEVAKEPFTKELEKNLLWHRANETILKDKLEAYQKNFLDFIYDSPTSTKVLGQDEKTKARPSGIAQEEEVQIKEP